MPRCKGQSEEKEAEEGQTDDDLNKILETDLRVVEQVNKLTRTVGSGFRQDLLFLQKGHWLKERKIYLLLRSFSFNIMHDFCHSPSKVYW